MLQLNTMSSQPGSTKRRKRLGRGSGSGHGPTAGKGDKGQLARSGGSVRPGFEGGQMPLYRRIPKRGFTNVARRTQLVVNVADLERFASQSVSTISLQELAQAGLSKGRFDRLVVLGTGELTKKVTVHAHKVSPSAAEKIQKAGGTVEQIAIPSTQGKKKTKRK